MLLAAALTLAALRTGVVPHAPATDRPQLVIFGCDERPLTGLLERTVWSAPALREELEGFDVLRLESCRYPAYFELRVGQPGRSAACVLTPDGGTLALVTGAPDGESALEFLRAARAAYARQSAAARAHSDPTTGTQQSTGTQQATGTQRATGTHRASHECEDTAAIDDGLALGAARALRGAIEARAGCATEPASRRSLCERAARACAWIGELAGARAWLDAGRAERAQADAASSARELATETMIELAARRPARAAQLLDSGLPALWPEACESSAWLAIAERLHAAGDDARALEALARVEAAAASGTDHERLRTRRAADRQRAHVGLPDTQHTHTGTGP